MWGTPGCMRTTLGYLPTIREERVYHEGDGALGKALCCRPYKVRVLYSYLPF